MRAVFLAAALASASTSATAIELSPGDVDAIGRVVYAEAGNQPIHGKVAVVETILNRLAAGRFGHDVQSVIEQRHAFEPVTKAGGWRNLPALTDAQRVEFHTVMSLKASGLLGEAAPGATYFQNEAIVRQRASAGKVRAALVGFGGMPRTAVIADHTFYSPSPSAARAPAIAISGGRHPVATLFVGESEDDIKISETRLILADPGDVAAVSGLYQP